MQKTIKILTALAQGLGVVTTLTSVVSLIPEKYTWIGLAAIGVAQGLKNVILEVLDYLDDGQKNGSVKL